MRPIADSAAFKPLSFDAGQTANFDGRAGRTTGLDIEELLLQGQSQQPGMGIAEKHQVVGLQQTRLCRRRQPAIGRKFDGADFQGQDTSRRHQGAQAAALQIDTPVLVAANSEDRR